MWGLCKCKYSIHLFNSVHICALWFCEAFAGEMSIFLTFLALEPGHGTVESWSVSCVSTAFTYVWIKGCLRFWFVLFSSLSMWLPLLGVWLKWLFCWMALQMLIWVLMPAFPLLPFAFWVALFSDLVDTFYSRIFANSIGASDVFCSCSTSFKLLELLPDSVAVTSGDSSLMIFEMKVWSFRLNRKMSHCRTDSVTAL